LGLSFLIYLLLPGLHTLSGKRLQNYLSSELRDRIRSTCAMIAVEDRIARNRCVVEPRIYSGQRLFEVERAARFSGKQCRDRIRVANL